MTRKVLLAVAGLSVLLLIESCASVPLVFDESLPEVEASHLFFYQGINITAYNGIAIPQKKQFLIPDVSTWRDVILPPGEMEFSLNIWLKSGNFIYSAKNIAFRYKFEPGKSYTIDFNTHGGPDNNQWGAQIYDELPPKFGWLQKDKLLAFVPFYKDGE